MLEKWEKLKQEKQCYAPAPPFYDFCNNVQDSDGCRACMKQNGIVDFIE